MSTPIAPVEYSSEIASLMDEIASQGNAFSRREAGTRERLISKARDLIASLETPVEMVTWITWAEVRVLQPVQVCTSPNCVVFSDNISALANAKRSCPDSYRSRSVRQARGCRSYRGDHSAARRDDQCWPTLTRYVISMINIFGIRTSKADGVILIRSNSEAPRSNGNDRRDCS